METGSLSRSLAAAAWAVAAAAPAAWAAPRPQGETVQVTAGRVFVEAAGSPLGELLLRLAEAASVADLYVDPELRERPVDVSLRDLTVRAAFEAIADTGHASLAISGTEDPTTLRIYVSDRDGLGPGVRGASAGQPGSVVASPHPFAGEPAPRPAAEAAEPRPVEPTPEQRERTERTLRRLNAALAAPPAPKEGPRAVGLPFPGPDGKPLVTIVDPSRERAPHPFAGMDGQPSTAPRPARTRPVDPDLMRLIQALTPPPDAPESQ